MVAALIQNGRQVLMSQRRADQSLPLHWEFPGGKIEPGESPQRALQREITEELGCLVKVGRIDDVVFHAYEDFDLLMLVYRCEIMSGVPTAVQVAAVAWVSLDDTTNLLLPPADLPIVRRLVAGFLG